MLLGIALPYGPMAVRVINFESPLYLEASYMYRDTSLVRKRPPPYDPPLRP